MAVSKTENPVLPKSRYAVSWCLIGGTYKVYGPNSSRERTVWDKLQTVIGGTDTITIFNDNSTIIDIRKLVKKAGV